MTQSAHQRRMAMRLWGQPAPAPAAVAAAPPAPRARRAGLFSLLRHPLFLLLASSLLVSGVGRLYNDYAERVRDRAERREQLAPLLVELRYRTLLITREVEPMADYTREFMAKYDDPAAQEELAKAFDFFGQEEEVDPEVANDLRQLEVEYDRIQPGVLAVVRGEQGTSDPQFAKVHLAVICYRIELLSRLPAQHFADPPKGAPPEELTVGTINPAILRPDVGIMSGLLTLEQNLVFAPSDFNRAVRMLVVYADIRERNYAAELLPVEQGEAAPEATNYLAIVDREIRS